MLTQEDPSTSVAAISTDANRSQKLMEMFPLKLSHLPQEEKVKLLDCIKENLDVFALDSSELGTTNVVTHTIDTGEKNQFGKDLDVLPLL